MRVFRAATAPPSDGLRCGIIHGDANEQNLVVDATGGRITGLLDWGDCSWSWLAAEPAIAATYLMLLTMDQQPQADPLSVLRDFCKGYDGVLPLQRCERDALRALCCGRLVQSLSIGALSAAQHPANADYLLTTSTSGWALLERLLAITDAHFLQACGLEPRQAGA